MTEADLSRSGRHGGLGHALLAAALALPWLLEAHAAPWTLFFHDLSMAVVLLVLAAWLCVRSGTGWQATPLVLGVAAFTLVPPLQSLAGVLAYPAEGVLVALYLGGFALAILTGLRAETLAPGRTAEALLAGLAIAALVSVGLQLYQWLQLDSFGVMVQELPALGRPFANVGQPNLLATLLVWGLIALWWALEHERIGPFGAALAAAFLLLGVAMTQSRAGWLEVSLLAGCAFWRPSAMRRPPSRRAVVLLMLWFLCAVWAWPYLATLSGMAPARSLTELAPVNERLATWRMALDAIAARPWLGWGWNQGTAAQLAVSGAYPTWQPLSPFMHNLVLDLLVWNGVPLGLLASAGLATWFFVRWRDAGAPQQRLLLLALAVLLIHAMLELPHGYAIFLLPAGLMMGMVEAHGRARSVFTLPRWSVAAWGLVVALALGLLVADFRAVQQDLLALRMHEARIANLPALGPPPQATLMTSHGELLASLRVMPQPGLDAETLALLHRVAHRHPSLGNLFRLAQASALNDRPDEARAALQLICQLQPPADCAAVAQHWRRLAESDQPALAAVAPPEGAGAGRPSAAGTMPGPTADTR